ncbi:stress-induced protein KIN2 [Prunus yedoensis var. nudiflora]|uniref:Stress-induced protein KIN2 n=1 Tax=Prunus yedoensis var. nudiflora TaxID=2094558 RepID=A0A314URM0_PRUYE|nr:stress-induced protein KIN2 [Prunus yedoensis var. nudiflora]
MATNSEKLSFHAGEAKGQTQIDVILDLTGKGEGVMDMANNAAQSTKETLQAAGQNVQAAAVGAVDAVKNATGLNKK